LGYLYALGTILFTVYGQLVLKWRINLHPGLPVGGFDKIKFLLSLLTDPYIFSGFVAAFIASLFWMSAMTKLQLSVAYPMMSLAFVLVIILSSLLLNEPIGMLKILGTLLIFVGMTCIGFSGVR